MAGKIENGASRKEGPQLGSAAAQHHVEPRLDRAGIDQSSVCRDSAPIGPGIVDHRDADAKKLSISELNLILELLPSNRRNLRRDECLRSIDQHPRRFTI